MIKTFKKVVRLLDAVTEKSIVGALTLGTLFSIVIFLVVHAFPWLVGLLIIGFMLWAIVYTIELVCKEWRKL